MTVGVVWNMEEALGANLLASAGGSAGASIKEDSGGARMVQCPRTEAPPSAGYSDHETRTTMPSPSTMGDSAFHWTTGREGDAAASMPTSEIAGSMAPKSTATLFGVEPRVAKERYRRAPFWTARTETSC
jgi:hypothetical protein